MSIINKIDIDNKLLDLIQEDNFIGWVYSINYEKALIVTNDEWKQKVKGIPHNSFLVATSFNPKKFSETDDTDQQVILFRVNGSCKLPQDDDMIRTKIDGFQKQKAVFIEGEDEDYDVFTKNKMQFSGLECRVLGTFYIKNEDLVLGSDIETFYTSLKLNVYMPTGTALEQIVNYVDPIRKKSSKSEFKALGIQGEVEPFKIGTVRYTSTDRLHRTDEDNLVPFTIQPSDFLARRTAVLGMTRTGKSNMIKQTISVVKGISQKCNLPIGQLIYDINGEYANANEQDKGAIADIYKDDCIRYRMINSDGFKPLLNNFYEQLEDGHNIICDVMKENSSSSASDIVQFMNLTFDKPETFEDQQKWKRKIALYKVLLYVANFQPKYDQKVYFEANEKVRNIVNPSVNPKNGLALSEAYEWFKTLREHKDEDPINKWITDECKCMLNLLCQKNDSDNYITGYKLLTPANKYHSYNRTEDVSKEIYDFLSAGKIIIIDLSVGNAALREKTSKKIAKYIFNKSMEAFTDGKKPSNIVVYIEEAHNLIGKKMELTDTWPRLAKEGAKYRIALVYATQEVSSVHPNILANTENWFVTHLNSEKEIGELAKFYDFSDFSQSLLRSQDVGFARVKTLSSPFVIPIQIDRFDPEKIRREQNLND
ncbi:MAG: DUF87 domain-containing protein [Corallococcus sp.]|nr:DUF87 domain-containing protein [Corallococcus sp.]MCM1359067.1 DUF87 domain-containing protein [Corallococcus sp.]MCM1395056.1 DUF87 domain-containing protein [Corallococcus sp.]